MTDALDLSGDTFKDLAMAFTNFFSKLKPMDVTELDESTKKTTSAFKSSGFGPFKDKNKRNLAKGALRIKPLKEYRSFLF